MIQLIFLLQLFLQPCLLMEMVEECVVYVDSVTGNDRHCYPWDGPIPSLPCATINMALEVLDTGCKSIKIEVNPGKYTLDYGEPVYYMYSNKINLAIIGSDESNTTVECKPSSSRCLLSVRNNVTIESMTVNNCDGDCGVAFNIPELPCVSCERAEVIKGWGLLIALEFIPVTVIVVAIAILNVNLNQGSLKAYIFYCQMMWKASTIIILPIELRPFGNYTVIPYSIWNFDFIIRPPICILPNTTPLQAILINYVIAFYPFLLLAIIYGCIVMYDKGWKWVIIIIRPIHRVLARFWRRFNIQPSLPHTIASVYTLCFTLIADTSIKILHPITYKNDSVFFYDGSVRYFNGWHGVAGTLALIVLIVFIIIPTVYLIVYPLKYFQKCCNKIKFRKDLLISVTDIFTGPYKNGTDNSLDYRSFVGIYFVLQIVALFLFCFVPGNHTQTVVTIATTVCCVVIVTICVFRPYKKDIHTFTESTIMITILILLVIVLLVLNINKCRSNSNGNDKTTFIGLVYTGDALMLLILLVATCYCIVWMVRKFRLLVRDCYNRPHIVHIQNREGDDHQGDMGGEDEVMADRLVNPGDYDHERQQLLGEADREVNPPNNATQRPQHQAMTY